MQHRHHNILLFLVHNIVKLNVLKKIKKSSSKSVNYKQSYWWKLVFRVVTMATTWQPHVCPFLWKNTKKCNISRNNCPIFTNFFLFSSEGWALQVDVPKIIIYLNAYVLNTKYWKMGVWKQSACFKIFLFNFLLHILLLYDF